MTLFELPESVILFKKLFNIAYSVSDPILPLKRIMHWQTVRERFPIPTPDLDQLETLVFGGYFFNFSTQQPTESEIRAAIDFGRSKNVRQFFVPTVRDDIDESSLIAQEFVKLPWFVESIFDVDDSIDSLLLTRVGKRRFREIKAEVTSANERYSLIWTEANSLRSDPVLFEKIVSLHRNNIEKYNHTVNLYPSDVLHSIMQSHLSENITVLARYEKTSGALIQVAICMKDEIRKDLFVLVQGRDYEHDPAGLNLYNSFFYEFYRYAEEQGLKTIYLGRGNHDLKRRLGANRFRVLNNWICSKDEMARSQLNQIAALAKESLQLPKSGNTNEGK